ncbi:unnamed protein product [Vitrella brassicaformis CCMP3155]|uniref:Uncharacterized protein n=1 Tax=Vitrella brassicaformis (strain CCMP3155) TaxID=1169540 RepID=A0A0G4FY48_VITBC|nr:unnamed protein product [Vitrella brassicaformis CCMP3155]|eukprot:CEM20079.1 unnamed protein product [Vitrella brassicaformis CCMP3155]
MTERQETGRLPVEPYKRDSHSLPAEHPPRQLLHHPVTGTLWGPLDGSKHRTAPEEQVNRQRAEREFRRERRQQKKLEERLASKPELAEGQAQPLAKLMTDVIGRRADWDDESSDPTKPPAEDEPPTHAPQELSLRPLSAPATQQPIPATDLRPTPLQLPSPPRSMAPASDSSKWPFDHGLHGLPRRREGAERAVINPDTGSEFEYDRLPPSPVRRDEAERARINEERIRARLGAFYAEVSQMAEDLILNSWGVSEEGEEGENGV